MIFEGEVIYYSRSTALQDAVLLKIRGNAEALDSLVIGLPQILGCPDFSMIHCIIQQRR